MPNLSETVTDLGKVGMEGALSTGTKDVASQIGIAGRNPPIKNFNWNWSKTNTSYSGCDINAIINLNGKLLRLGNLSTISYSIHREKQPVRTLGRIYSKGYVRGPLTIAGSLIFTVFDQHVLNELRGVIDYEVNIADLQKSILPHQFPPFDIVITYNNEYGHASVLKIYGVELIDEGQTHSINDMISENMMQYIARDIDLMIKVGDILTPQNLAFKQAMFSSDHGQSNTQSINESSRQNFEKKYAEYINFIQKLEKEIKLWKKNKDNSDIYTKLNIYKKSEKYRTLIDANYYLSTLQQQARELAQVLNGITNTTHGVDPSKDNPFDH